MNQLGALVKFLFLFCLLFAFCESCSNGRVGYECELDMNANCAMLDGNSNLCFNMNYLDCPNTLDVTVYTAKEYIERSQLVPAGSTFNFDIKGDWQQTQICQKINGSYCNQEDGLCNYCIKVTALKQKTTSEIAACIRVTIDGNEDIFPAEFCSVIDYAVCGGSGYYYAPCEHKISQQVVWNPSYLLDFENTQFLSIGAGSVESCITKEGYPVQCYNFLVDTCASKIILEGTGDIFFSREIDVNTKAFCEGTEMCLNITSFYYDAKNVELQIRFSAIFYNSPVLSFPDISYHYPKCGVINCVGQPHVAADIEQSSGMIVYSEPSLPLPNGADSESSSAVIELPQQSVTKKPSKDDKEANNNNTVLIGSITGSVGGAFVLAILFLSLVVVGRKIYIKRKTYETLVDEEIEMDDLRPNKEADLWQLDDEEEFGDMFGDEELRIVHAARSASDPDL